MGKLDRQITLGLVEPARWSVETATEAASTCLSRTEFRKRFRGAYNFSRRVGLLDQVCLRIKSNKETWSEAKVIEEVKKYNYRSELRENAPGAFSYAKRTGMLDYIYSVLSERPRSKWTKALAMAEAGKYSTKKEFFINSPSAYNYCKYKGILERACVGYIDGRIKWTKDRIKEVALTCETRVEFQKKHASAYQRALDTGVLDDACSHMLRPKIKPRGHWTKDKIQQEAFNYNSRKAFELGSPGAYTRARRIGILNTVCSHMTNSNSKEKRYVYAIIGSKKECPRRAYIGLSLDVEKRYKEHLASGSQVARLLQDPLSIKIVFGPLTAKNAQLLEQDKIAKYSEQGFSLINMRPGGSLGSGALKWDFETCTKAAKRYKTRGAFSQGEHKRAYEVARKNGWLDEICSHMKPVNPNVYNRFYYEDVVDKAKKCKTYSKFLKKAPRYYRAAQRNGWLDSIKGILEQKNV